ncbi:MAG: hypothetical protein ACPL25_10305 [Ignavibacteria bacterium]
MTNINGKSSFPILIILIFPLTVFALKYFLISNDAFIEEALNKIENKMLEKGEDVSDLLDMTKSILENPGYKITISLKESFLVFRNFILLNLLSYLALLLIVEIKVNPKEYLEIISKPVLLLIIGWIFNTGLKLFLVDFNACSCVRYFLSYQLNEIELVVFRNSELFTLGYLIWLSLSLSKSYKETIFLTAFMVFGNYLLLTFSSVMIGFMFVLVY